MKKGDEIEKRYQITRRQQLNLALRESMRINNAIK